MKQEKIALLTPQYVGYEGISKLTKEKAIKFTKEGKDVTVFTFQYDNTIIPFGYKIHIMKSKLFNNLNEDFLIDGTLLKPEDKW